jgi:hypothetical protein
MLCIAFDFPKSPISGIIFLRSDDHFSTRSVCSVAKVLAFSRAEAVNVFVGKLTDNYINRIGVLEVKQKKCKMDEQKNARWTSKQIWRSRTPSWVGSGWGRRYGPIW